MGWGNWSSGHSRLHAYFLWNCLHLTDPSTSSRTGWCNRTTSYGCLQSAWRSKNLYLWALPAWSLFQFWILTYLLKAIQTQIRLATADVNLGILELYQFQLNTVGTLTKIIYAFLWQEYALTGNDIFLDPEVNILGASAMVSVNKFVDWLTSFPMLDGDIQKGKKIMMILWLMFSSATGYGTYPGDTWCNPQEPHSKWHVESANGLMDLMMLADSIFKLTMWLFSSNDLEYEYTYWSLDKP